MIHPESLPVLLALLAGLAGVALTAAGPADTLEPDLEQASRWWPELPNKWTVVGWKDHLYRFNVLFNGTLMNFPVRQNRAGTSERLQNNS